MGPGARVGVLGDRSIWTYAGILASSWAGAAYVPLDPDYPEQRLARMLKDADLKFLLKNSSG